MFNEIRCDECNQVIGFFKSGYLPYIICISCEEKKRDDEPS